MVQGYVCGEYAARGLKGRYHDAENLSPKQLLLTTKGVKLHCVTVFDASCLSKTSDPFVPSCGHLQYCTIYNTPQPYRFKYGERREIKEFPFMCE